ncbi:hypothetical protein QJS10_CPB19g01714 [Acorus calamus]|uniref:Uncharacterized protein n=1 Tax=Acorus calamus TaxID=4465 RepID=A0AAV9CHT5_ACOCL|nr:hypothetical protein QJS10_CPB19g01714 [Acorus calamus]
MEVIPSLLQDIIDRLVNSLSHVSEAIFFYHRTSTMRNMLVMQGTSSSFAKHVIPSICKHHIITTFAKSQQKRRSPSDSPRFAPSIATGLLIPWGCCAISGTCPTSSNAVICLSRVDTGSAKACPTLASSPWLFGLSSTTWYRSLSAALQPGP